MELVEIAAILGVNLAVLFSVGFAAALGVVLRPSLDDLKSTRPLL